MQSFNFTGSLPTFSSIFSFLPRTFQNTFSRISRISGKTKREFENKPGGPRGGWKSVSRTDICHPEFWIWNFIFLQPSGTYCPLAVKVRYQKVLCKDWKVSGSCPAGDRCNRWTFCTVVQHTALGTQAWDTSQFGSSMFCFRWNELPVDGDQWSAPGALGQQRARRQKQPAFDVSYSKRSELTTVEDTGCFF